MIFLLVSEAALLFSVKFGFLSPGVGNSRLSMLKMHGFHVFRQYQSNPNVLADYTCLLGEVRKFNLLPDRPSNYMVIQYRVGKNKRK